MTNLGFINRLQAWLPLAPLLVLLGGTYWLDQQVQPLPNKPDDARRHDPDYILDNFSAMSLNEQGAPRVLVAARKMEHYPDDDSTVLEDPHVYSLYANSPPISISAQNGEISKDGDRVILRDGVRIVRDADARQSEMTVSTNYLRVLPDRDIADTDSPITLSDAHTVINAVGMKLNYRTREITLLAQVRSRHDPAKD
jgi:lipopolysaccharide export system protein LptC